MIDLYCERLDPDLWAEPINAFTNLAFLVAAFVSWRLAVQHKSLSIEGWILIGLMAIIGIGSGLFHTFATTWSRYLDVIPILLYQITFLWFYGRRVVKLQAGYLAGAVVVYLIAAHLGRQFPHILNGSLIYAPAFLLTLVLGVYHYRHAKKEHNILLLAIAVFTLSLFFRSIDQIVCTYFPIGTHFLWHLFNGLLVYLTFRGLVVNLPVIQKEPDRN